MVSNSVSEPDRMLSRCLPDMSTYKPFAFRIPRFRLFGSLINGSSVFPWCFPGLPEAQFVRLCRTSAAFSTTTSLGFGFFLIFT